MYYFWKDHVCPVNPWLEKKYLPGGGVLAFLKKSHLQISILAMAIIFMDALTLNDSGNEMQDLKRPQFPMCKYFL